jgi:hypothetical protein
MARDLFEKNLPSAYQKRPALPLTVGEVAERLRAKKRVPQGDEEASRRLLTDGTPVPTQLDESQMAQLITLLPIQASQRFWRAFREQAMLLLMGRTSAQAQLGLAREARPKKVADEAPKEDEEATP